MRFSVAAAAATLLSVVSVQAADHVVQVGAGGQLVFSPSEVDGAVVGDTVSFQFQGKNHPVAAGATSLPQFSFNITNATAPLWFFCAQTSPVSHCGSGMVFALNPTTAKNFSTFQATANATLSSSTTAGTSATSGTASSTATTPAATTSAPASGALKLGGSAAGAMTLAALVIGLVL